MHVFRFHGDRHGERNWSLGVEEWFHLSRVLRLSVGEQIEICNGLGFVALAELNSISKNSGSFRILQETFFPSKDPEMKVAVGVSALKSQSFEDVLPSLIEVGVDEIFVFLGEGVDKSRAGARPQERATNILTAACKQSKRAWFPSVHWVQTIKEFCQSGQLEAYTTKIVLDPDAAENLSCLPRPLKGPSFAMVGSEKGLTREELRLFVDAGCLPVRLGPDVMRATTALLTSAVLLSAKNWGYP